MLKSATIILSLLFVVVVVKSDHFDKKSSGSGSSTYGSGGYAINRTDISQSAEAVNNGSNFTGRGLYQSLKSNGSVQYAADSRYGNSGEVHSPVKAGSIPLVTQN